MTTAIADTNIFLRVLINEHEHHRKAVALFAKVKAKKLRLVWPSVIFIEVIHVLKTPRYYHLDRTEIAALLTPLLKLPGLKLEEPELAKRALGIFATTTLDIADAWLIAKARSGKVNTICSFDQDYTQIPGVELMTP